MGSVGGVSFWVLVGGGGRPVGHRQVAVGSYACIAAASRGGLKHFGPYIVRIIRRTKNRLGAQIYAKKFIGPG